MNDYIKKHLILDVISTACAWCGAKMDESEVNDNGRT